MPTAITSDTLRRRLRTAQFFMLRYETEFTPCTGITAVNKQERRNFSNGVVLAPWCPALKRKSPADDPVASGKVRALGWSFKAGDFLCEVMVTTDDLAPIVFLSVPGRFRGVETPYDTPAEAPDHDPAATLRMDALVFGLAVDVLLRDVGNGRQFVWAADWETVPAMWLVRERHLTALTLHNTFDECLSVQAWRFGERFAAFNQTSTRHHGYVTALELGIDTADVVTTVNRGFAFGMRQEPLLRDVMAGHLRDFLPRVVGINNAAFAPLDPKLVELRQALEADPATGLKQLLARKEKALAEMPAEIKAKAKGKAIVASMGRRVSQKQHDVLVEAVRWMLRENEHAPILVIFSTVHGDTGSPARLQRMEELAEEFPDNVVCIDGFLKFFSALMAAADFNCMPSLYEPHGGAYDGTVVPIARAVDGLAEQICALHPQGEAERLNGVWHTPDEAPTGFLFREPVSMEHLPHHELRELLSQSPTPWNWVFRSMCESLKETLKEAVAVRLERPEVYAKLVLAALRKQEGTSWLVNLGGILGLVEAARVRIETQE